MHAHAGKRQVQRDKFAELLKRSMMNYVDPETHERRPLSQRYLARNVIDVNEQTISRWARQETAPSAEMVEKVAAFFEWSDEDLDVVFGLAGAEELFDEWRLAVGFPKEFPRLSPLLHPWPERNTLGQEQATPDSMRFFLSKEQREVAREVYESLGSAPLVRFAPGHGATTLARWVHDQAAQEALGRRTIPVLVSLEQMVDASYEELVDAEQRFLIEAHGREALGRGFAPDVSEDRLEDLMETADERATAYFGHIGPRLCAETIEAQIRFAVIRSLATQPWERVLTLAQYAMLMGVPSADLATLEAMRTELATAFDRVSSDAAPRSGFWAGVSAIAPNLGHKDYHEILRELNRWGRVRVSLMLDLSATPMGRQYLGREHGEYLTEPYIATLRNVNEALRVIEQEASGGLDTTFFLSTRAWSAFSAEFQAQDDQAIDFPAYRPVDLFAMLADHYPPENREHAGGRVEVLAAVLDSEFLELNERTAISTAMVLLEHELKHELLSRKGGVAYHLRKSLAGDSLPRDPVTTSLEEEAVERLLERVREEIAPLIKAEVERQLRRSEASEQKE